jgi:hypothetical protein
MPRDFITAPSHITFILANTAALCSAAALLGGALPKHASNASSMTSVSHHP